MTQHTHGPWTWVKRDLIYKRLDDAEGHSVLWPDEYQGEAWIEVDSDHARLIAAAPETAAERDRLREINAELLKALYEVRHHADDEAGFMVDVRAAIARAEGEDR